MSKQSEDAFLNITLNAWQPKTRRRLTHEDARQMVENVAGFFGLLNEWIDDEHRNNSNFSSLDLEQ